MDTILKLLQLALFVQNLIRTAIAEEAARRGQTDAEVLQSAEASLDANDLAGRAMLEKFKGKQPQG